MEVNLPIEQAWEAISKIWHNERTTFIWAMVIMLLFVWYIVFSFLQALETKDQRFTQSLDKVSDALRDNTQVMLELKSTIK